MGADLDRRVDEPWLAGVSQWACDFCGQGNPPRAKFCNECGAPRQLRPCWVCEAINARDAARCHSCGASLDDRGPIDFDAAEATLAALVESQHSESDIGPAVVEDAGEIVPPNRATPNSAAPERLVATARQPGGQPSIERAVVEDAGDIVPPNPVASDAAAADRPVASPRQPGGQPSIGPAVVEDAGDIVPPIPVTPDAAAADRPVASPRQPGERLSLHALTPSRRPTRAVSYVLGSILIAAGFLTLVKGVDKASVEGSAVSFHDGPVPTGGAAQDAHAVPTVHSPAPAEPPTQVPTAEPSPPADRTGDSEASPEPIPKTTSASVVRDPPAGVSTPRRPAKAAPRKAVEPRATEAIVVESQPERHVESAKPEPVEAPRVEPPPSSVRQRPRAPAGGTPTCADPSAVLSGCLPGA